MTYAGATGMPGSFYLRVSDLVELASVPEATPQPPAGVSQPLPPYTPPATYPAPRPSPSRRPPRPRRHRPSLDTCGTQRCAHERLHQPTRCRAPAHGSRLVPIPATTLPPREETHPTTVHEQPRTVPQTAPRPTTGATADRDGRLAGGALASLILLACGFRGLWDCIDWQARRHCHKTGTQGLGLLTARVTIVASGPQAAMFEQGRQENGSGGQPYNDARPTRD